MKKKKKSSGGDLYSKFKPMSKEGLKKSIDELKKGKFAQTMKFEVGDNLVRFLPNPNSDKDEFYLDTVLHWSMGSEDKQTAVVCNKVFNKACPVCDFVDEVKDKLKGMDKEDKDAKKVSVLVNKIQRNRRVYAYGINMNDDKNKIVTIAIGKKLMEDILDLSYENYDSDVVSDPKEGVIVKIKRTGTGQFDTKYKAFLKDAYKVPEEILEKLLEMPSLEKSVTVVDEDKLEELLNETKLRFAPYIDIDTDDEEDEDEKKSKKKSKKDKLSKKKVKDEEEDEEEEDEDDEQEDDDDEEEDDDDDDEEEEEEEEEEDDDDDDDDDEDDDEDEDEEEEPKKKKKSSTSSKLDKLGKKLKRRK